MGKSKKIALVSAIVLLYILSLSSDANAGFFDWLVSKEDSNNLLIASSRDNNFSISNISGLKTTFPNQVAEEPKTTYRVVRESYRQVTAYNVGDPYQTDSTPCIGAYSKVNLCDEIEKGVKVCAANFVPLHTKLRIITGDNQSFECIVWDRMNSRYTSRVDIAMSLSEKIEARQHGLKQLKVQILAEETSI